MKIGMIRMIRCDRCGDQEIDEEKPMRGWKVFSSNSLYQSHNLATDSAVTWDLCPDCARRVFHALEKNEE